MHDLPERNKNMLLRNIRHYKKVQFPGKGSGVRLSQELGVSPQTLSSWLNGKRLPTFHQLFRLSHVFGVSPLELCGIRKRKTDPQGASHISLFLELLKRQNALAKAHVEPHIRENFMKNIKVLVEKELECDI